MASVDAEVVALSAAWTGQAVGVQQFDEPVVTGRLIEQIGHGKVHGGRSRLRRATTWTTPTLRESVKRPAPI